MQYYPEEITFSVWLYKQNRAVVSIQIHFIVLDPPARSFGASPRLSTFYFSLLTSKF